MNYIDRYRNGEYQQVWLDIINNEKRVNEENYPVDVLEVTRETMKRVRHNIELLIHQLQEIEFSFGYDTLLRSYLSLPSTLSYQSQYFEAFLWSRKQPPVFLPANLDDLHNDVFDIDEDILQNIMKEQRSVDRALGQENSDTSIDESKKFLSSFPLSMQAWYEHVGGVNFYGFHPRWLKEYSPEHGKNSIYYENKYFMSKCDFLMIAPLTSGRVIPQHGLTSGQGVYEFAPDQHEKCYLAGGKSPYRFSFPNPQADFFLSHLSWSHENSLSFVDYLRTSLLRWAGFPGMASWPKVPEEDLAFLTKDLIPF